LKFQVAILAIMETSKDEYLIAKRKGSTSPAGQKGIPL
jgi:hypothetical protein